MGEVGSVRSRPAPDTIGDVSVTIITDAWVHTVCKPGNWDDLTRLYGLALQAKA